MDKAFFQAFMNPPIFSFYFRVNRCQGGVIEKRVFSPPRAPACRTRVRAFTRSAPLPPVAWAWPVRPQGTWSKATPRPSRFPAEATVGFAPLPPLPAPPPPPPPPTVARAPTGCLLRRRLHPLLLPPALAPGHWSSPRPIQALAGPRGGRGERRRGACVRRRSLKKKKL